VASRAAADGDVLTAEPTRIVPSPCNTPLIVDADLRWRFSFSPSWRMPSEMRSLSDFVPVVRAISSPGSSDL
jgi:hypothetical protein